MTESSRCFSTEISRYAVSSSEDDWIFTTVFGRFQLISDLQLRRWPNVHDSVREISVVVRSSTVKMNDCYINNSFRRFQSLRNEDRVRRWPWLRNSLPEMPMFTRPTSIIIQNVYVCYIKITCYTDQTRLRGNKEIHFDNVGSNSACSSNIIWAFRVPLPHAVIQMDIVTSANINKSHNKNRATVLKLQSFCRSRFYKIIFFFSFNLQKFAFYFHNV